MQRKGGRYEVKDGKRVLVHRTEPKTEPKKQKEINNSKEVKHELQK